MVRLFHFDWTMCYIFLTRIMCMHACNCALDPRPSCSTNSLEYMFTVVVLSRSHLTYGRSDDESQNINFLAGVHCSTN